MKRKRTMQVDPSEATILDLAEKETRVAQMRIMGLGRLINVIIWLGKRRCY